EEHAAAAFRATFGTGFGEEAVDWLIEHPRPAWIPLLQGALAEAHDQRARDDLESGLVRLGDLAPLPALLGRIDALPARFLKRLLPALRETTDPQVIALLRAAASNTALREDRRELLVEALAARPHDHERLLRELFEREDDDGTRLAALRGLLATPSGSALLADLGAAVGARPLRAREEDLAFEVLGAANLPLAPAVVEFAARLMLGAPLTGPVAEAVLALSDRGDPAAFPLVHPLGELLRRDPRAEHGAVLARVLADARAHRNAHALTRRRLGHLLHYVAYAEPVYAVAGPALAEAIV